VEFGTEVWLIPNYEILFLLIDCSFKQIYFQKEILNLVLGVTMSCFDVGCDINARVTYAVRTHSKQDPIYVFPEIKLRGLVPNFHIHVSVSNLNIPMIGPHILMQQIHECRYWERGRAVSFLGIFVSIFRYSVYAVYPQIVQVQIIHYKIIRYGSILFFSTNKLQYPSMGD
jgi:hypothetical protein